MSGSAALLPVGLDGWLPVLKKRSSSASAWTTYIATSFFGVDRSVNPDRLAGAFVDATGATGDAQKKSHTVTTLIKKLRRQGSLCDMIVMNDDDFLEFAREIETHRLLQRKRRMQQSASLIFLQHSLQTM